MRENSNMENFTELGNILLKMESTMDIFRMGTTREEGCIDGKMGHFMKETIRKE